jgi:hypothetical protein
MRQATITVGLTVLLVWTSSIPASAAAAKRPAPIPGCTWVLTNRVGGIPGVYRYLVTYADGYRTVSIWGLVCK